MFEKVKRMFVEYPFHTYFIVLYFLLKNAADVYLPFEQWYEPVLIFGIFSSCIFCLFLIAEKRKYPLAMIGFLLSAVLFIFLFIVAIQTTLSNIVVGFFEHVRTIIIFYAIPCILLLFGFFKGYLKFNTVSYYLGILFLSLSLWDAGRLIFEERSSNYEKQETEAFKNINPKYNIYLLVLDGYASQKNLSQYWHFDNSKFQSFLKEKGFFIAQNSHSNYCYTLETMASMLELKYLPNSYTEGFLSKKINNSTTAKYLFKEGYEISASNFNGTFHGFTSDTRKVKYKEHLFQQSMIGIIAYSLFDKFMFEENHGNDLTIFDKFSNIVQQKNNKLQFLYCHSMLTHSPFYDPKSEKPDSLLKTKPHFADVGLGTISKPRLRIQLHDSTLMNIYLSRIQLTNQLVQKTLDSLWYSIESNSVVILISDHGFRYLSGMPEDVNKEMYENFCAIYFPDKDYSSLTDTITPINVMRMSLNRAIGSKLSYLPDKMDIKN
jgi:hypothetical protein